MKLRAWFAAAGVLVVVTGCGSRASNAGGGGGAGSGGTQASGGQAGVAQAGADAGGSDAGADAAASCGNEKPPILVGIQRADGKLADCMDGPQSFASWTVSAKVVSAGTNSIVIDECGPTACVPVTSTITVTGDGLSWTAPAGAFVELSTAMQPSGGGAGHCTDPTLSIRRLADWQGVQNPIAGPAFYLLANTLPAESGLTSSLVGLGCETPLATCMSTNEELALGLSSDLGGPKQVLLMGETGTVTSSAGSFTLENLSSVKRQEPIDCYDVSHASFWAVPSAN